MLVSQCCQFAFHIKNTNCGYVYYCCEKCNSECIPQRAGLFPNYSHDKLLMNISIKDNEYAEV